MEINCDYRDLLNVLNQLQARFLVAGGYAVMKYTEPRFTKDLDLWIDPAPGNAERVFEALSRFGARLAGLTVKDFSDEATVYQIGVYPVRVDVLKAVPGLRFGEAWERRTPGVLGGVAVSFLSREDLIATKRMTNRAEDRVHLRDLLRESKRARP